MRGHRSARICGSRPDGHEFHWHHPWTCVELASRPTPSCHVPVLPCLPFFLPGRSHSLSTQWPSNKQSKQAPNSSSSQPTSHPASEPTNQPTNRFPATHSLSSLMSLATHSLNPPAQSIRSSLKVVALSTDASFSPSHSFPQSRHASSRLARCPFTLPAFIGVQNPSQL